MANAPDGEFEFLRGLPFGPYLPVDSPIHRLDPRARILLVVLLMAALTAARRPEALVVGLGLILLGWRVARVPLGPLWRGWRTVLPFLLILAALQIIFRVGAAGPALFYLGPLAVTPGSLRAAGMLLLRFSAYMALLGLAAACLSEAELTRGLQALLSPLAALGVPTQDFVLAVQVTLRYFPLLAQSAERIAKAQAARGADWQPAGWNLLRRIRQIIPLIVPLFVNSLRRAENMALAMDARGYGALPRRTSLVTLHFKAGDYAALIAGVLVTAALIVV